MITVSMSLAEAKRLFDALEPATGTVVPTVERFLENLGFRIEAADK